MEVTTALRKITSVLLKMKEVGKRILIVRGGQGAGKTFAILILIINSCSSNPNREWIIASEELSVMKDSVIKDFLKILEEFGIYSESRWNRSDFIYTFPNRSTIKFRPLAKEDAGKGVRVHGVYFNEINKIKFEAYNQYASRAEIVIGDYNPDAPFFVDDEIIPRRDCEFIQLTYTDNEQLNSVERAEIEGYKRKGYNPDGTIKDPYWANKWQVYGLGNIGALMGAVFNNWEIIEDIPAEARLRGGGGDFGYTNDPTAIIARYEYNGCPLYDEIAYEREMLNDKIASIIKKSVLAFSTIYFDAARPDSIADLRSRLKIRAIGADKMNVNSSIELLQRYEKIYVTRRSANIIQELRNYVWEVDRNGKATNNPVDKNNHAIDAMRYEEMGKGKYSGKYTIR